MREIPEVEAVIRGYITALSQETETLKTASVKKTPLYNGLLLSKDEEEFLYRFETETEQFLCDGTPVTVFTANGSVQGSVVEANGFDVILALPCEIDVIKVELSASPWFLLQDLCGRLEKMVKSSYESELYATLIEKRKTGLSEHGKIVTGQENAFQASQNRPITFLWGPPGTGKTYTLAEIAYAYYKKGIPTLILSHSNVAVDCALVELAKRLNKADEGKVLRYGRHRKKEIERGNITLSSYELALKADENLRAEQERLSRERKTVTFSDSAELEKQRFAFRKRVAEREESLVAAASVVGATLSRAVVSDVLSKRKFGAVLIDEASMCFVPQILYASSLATRRLVVVGDFRQLPPIVQDPFAKQSLGQDVFRFLGVVRGKQVCYHPWLVMLNQQRRMHPEIAALVSEQVYGGLLTTAQGVEELRENTVESMPFSGRATALLDIGDTFNVCARTEDGSRFNLLSAFISFHLALRSAEQGVETVIVAPYAAQVRLLRSLLADFPSPLITVSTVHQFQGSETETVIFDTVDFLRQPKAGYLLSQESEEDDVALRLLNVAVTRARGKFILLTNARYFATRLPQSFTLRSLISDLVVKERVFTPDHLSSLYEPVTLPELQLGFFGGDFPAFSKEYGECLEIIYGARKEIDLFMPDAEGDGDLLPQVVEALNNAKERGVRVRVYAENSNAMQNFLAVKRADAAMFPLLIADGNTVCYNPLGATKWLAVGHTSPTPLALAFCGRKTVETVKSLLFSMQKRGETTPQTELFGLKENAVADTEITGKSAYTAYSYCKGFATDQGLEGYFTFLKLMKKRFAFRFVKTKFGAECCFNAEDVWLNFFTKDAEVSFRVLNEGFTDLNELLSAANKRYGGKEIQ
ncbi:MAG: hypothetical protein E7363_02435 [Clostridiales bacterium]|nr:hypothetical protein [Clostridiales bacterium]